MKAKRFFHVKTKKRVAKGMLLSVFAVTLSLVTLTSCSDEYAKLVPSDEYIPQSFSYEAFVFGANGGNMLVLDSITGNILSIESSASWLTASVGDELADGHPVLLISSKDGDGDATITVTASNGDKAVIAVSHKNLLFGDAYTTDISDFINHWWDCDKVPLQGISMQQYTPWTIEGGAHIPNEIRKQYTPTQGWEMAFCYLNDEALEDVRSFALYNKWTGQMRVYSYIKDPSGWGNELMFRVYMGETNSTNMYPLYNMFQYGIPSNHEMGKSIKPEANLIETKGQTFMTWLTPYSQSASLSPGWYVCEFDMSGYVPAGKDWLQESKDEAKFKFYAETKDVQEITLKGALKGTLNGSFSNERIVQTGGTSALYGISNALGTLSGMASSSISSGNQYAQAMKNDPTSVLSPLKYWGGFACSMGSAILGYIAGIEDPISYDTIPGKIDLALDASLDLQGYLTKYTPNKIHPLAVSPKAISSANGIGGHVGKGVWGLADDPVVYIDKEVLMCNDDRCRIVNRGNGVYSQTEFDTYGMRMAWFFDPTSVKVNLNLDLFPDVSKVYVTTTCGVYPNRPEGNTDGYREMMTLKPRPSFDISLGKGVGQLVLLNQSSKVRLAVVAREDLLDTTKDGYETEYNSSFVNQPGGNMHFYGRVIDEFGKLIIVDPQVYVPYTKQGETFLISNPTAPDFVVTVNVVFESQGHTFCYSKCFIPRIEVIDHSTTLGHYERLKRFALQCDKNEITTTLANDGRIPVYYPSGGKLLTKTFRMMEGIK